jgi:hypothetical protein
MKMGTLMKKLNENDPPKRVDKTIAWLSVSRDGWRKKCIDVKKALKLKTQDCKRISESRDDWKLKNIRLKVELSNTKDMNSNLMNRINELESQLSSKNQELYELKKKQ